MSRINRVAYRLRRPKRLVCAPRARLDKAFTGRGLGNSIYPARNAMMITRAEGWRAALSRKVIQPVIRFIVLNGRGLGLCSGAYAAA